MKKIKASILPDGWYWKCFNDGSGSLIDPQGHSIGSYDLVPYHTQNGIEYVDFKGKWDIFWGSFDQYRLFIEKNISTKLLAVK